ncbi:hydroxysqualene dehydroxylase HpnE [Ramlibacter sp. MMS24-I3-19]|uniref:hydroxysqualene dehydroxylase HpnE n=1 Tax=Ramlibacter sp. MMS24-I3-19 TaxID=3416606 RepID=UPI003D04380E
MKLAVVGGGWAGLSAAVAGTKAGHAVTLFEAARQFGGRARSLAVTLPDGRETLLDNGQHILIGAYSETLALMRQVGVDPAQVLLRLPLTLRFPDGSGLTLPHWPAPFDAAWGIATARGWSWRDKLSLLRHAAAWRRRRFDSDPLLTVAALCAGLRPAVMRELIEPLCVAALNTPADRASAQVFLRVLRDALFAPAQGGWAPSNLLLPRADLGQLLPSAATGWLADEGADVRAGRRVQAIAPQGQAWLVDGEPFDAIVLACPSSEAQRLVAGAAIDASDWIVRAQSLTYEAIATVYTTGGTHLPSPMLALRSDAEAPAQFVFDRSLLGGPAGLLAWVASASRGDTATLEAQVLRQAAALGHHVQPLRTVLEKRATFACTPGLQRPPMAIAPGLVACGDYVEGPYPATLEGAVRAGQAAVAALTPAARTAR